MVLVSKITKICEVLQWSMACICYLDDVLICLQNREVSLPMIK